MKLTLTKSKLREMIREAAETIKEEASFVNAVDQVITRASQQLALEITKEAQKRNVDPRRLNLSAPQGDLAKALADALRASIDSISTRAGQGQEGQQKPSWGKPRQGE